jgi:hypothetical protein
VVALSCVLPLCLTLCFLCCALCLAKNVMMVCATTFPEVNRFHHLLGWAGSFFLC